MCATNASPFDVDQSRLMNRQKRSVVRISLYLGFPLLSAMAIYNLVRGDHVFSILICAMLLIVIFFGVVIRRRISEEFEYRIYSVLFRLFVAGVGIALLYEIGLRSNFSRIGWCYLFPLLIFFVVRTREGIVWVSIFYGALAFFVLKFDLQKVTLVQLQELRYRFLISLFVAGVLSLLLEHGFRHAQQRLLNHQRSLRESENRYRQAYEQLNTQMQERKQTGNMLRESESRFRDLVENALTGIYIMQDGQIVYKNPEQDIIFGPLPQPYNFNDFKNVHPEDVERVKDLYEKMISGEISNFDIDMRFFPGGGMGDTADMRWVQARARKIEYQGRRAILINMMDITRARELEHLMRVDDKMTSLGRAAAGIIHELRNPLSGINVYLTALQKIYNQPDKIESKSLEKVNEIIGKMQSASNKIESVIKRVMDFSKPSIPRLALTNINHSIQEAVGLSSATLRKYGIRIETSLRDDLPQCFTDSHLIEQVLMNLIMNASQAMEKTAGEKIIEVTSSVEENFVLIRVADSGPGVPPMLRKKIFDPFFTTKKDSSGIGLSVCYRIMADHGGSLNVLTSKWGGAEFRVGIPIEKRKGII
jgi:PAS domain S-box-containing protein